ncbi:MAG: hypothetical protein EA424_28545 [Planctomycetaceae bacterium]|nr:MAG: hypothetical protein EA424_28545 [Planctomycetaceae bacterium]
MQVPSFAFAGRSGMKAAQGSCFVAGTPVVAVSSHVAQVELAAEPAGGSGRPGWSVAYVGIFAGLTASAAARGVARRQRRRREDLERKAREALFGEVERHRESRSGLLAESLLEDVRWFEQDIPKGPDKTFDIVFRRGQWAAAVSEAVSGMDDFLDSSTQRGTGAAEPVAGTPESARPAVRVGSGPCFLSGSESALEPTLGYPAGAESPNRTAPPSPRSGHDNADRLAAAKPRRLPRSRPNRPAASRCRPWFWNAASILSLAVALVCLALLPPFGYKSAVDLEQTTLTATTAGPSLPTIPIERIRPGDWALAHNPELSDEERWAEGDGRRPEGNPDGWRLISMQLQKDDGGYVDIELLRPLEWIERHYVEIGGQVDVELTELGGAGWADVFNIRACPPIGPPPGAGFRVVTGRYAHSAGDTFDLRVTGLDGQPDLTIGVTATHPIWSVDEDDFVAAGDLLPGERLLTATGRIAHVHSLTPRPGPEPVYNLEVDVEHVYYVSHAGVLVHNTNLVCTPKISGRYQDAASKVNLRRKSLISGTTALKKAGLVRRPGQGGAYEFLDPKTKFVRAKWVPRKGREPQHWSKFDPFGNGGYINNAGRPVSSTHRSPRIPSNGGGPQGGTGPGSPGPTW